MKNKVTLFPVLFSTLLMSWLFYLETMGLNLLIYEAILLVWLCFTKQIPLETRLQKIVLSGFVVTGIATVFIHSTFSYVVHYLLFILQVGLWSYPLFRSLLHAGAQAFVNFFVAQWNFGRNLLHLQLRGKDFGYYLRKAGILVIPLIVVLVFFSIYRTSNPLFDKWFGDTGKWIAQAIENFFNYLDTPVFVTLFWSFVFSNFIFFRKSTAFITDDDIQAREDAVRKRRIGILGFKTTSLKNEYKAAVFMLAALNLLLLVMNFSDIRLVWFGFDWEGQYLKQFVHEGTYLLIYSILISIGIVLYFFRGNLNFYKKNKLLKKLSYVWLAQNAFLAVSVGMRNYWYITYYALAYKRIGVLLFLILTIYGLYSVYRKISKHKTARYLFRVNFQSLLILLTLSSLIDWDTAIARYNFSHAGKSFVHFSFLVDLSDKTLPYLDKSLPVLKQIQESQKDFPSEKHNLRPEEYYDQIQKRKINFLEEWETKSLLEWNWPEYKTAVMLKKPQSPL